MEPLNLYLAVVQTIAIFIILGFFCRWWYLEYQEMKELRMRYVRCISVDNAILYHKVTFIGICALAIAVLIYVWISV